MQDFGILWDTLRLFDEEPHTPIDVYAYYIERICGTVWRQALSVQHSME